MKSLFRIFQKNSVTVHVVAAVLIVCMAGADMLLYLEPDRFASNAAEYVETEEHVTETALADGYFGGRNSDVESGTGEPVDTSDGQPLFNILEIVPTEKKAVVGYMIGGCEPFDQAVGLKDSDTGKYLVTPQQMRSAYLDAFINPTPGSSNAKSWDYLNQNIGSLNSKLSESSTGKYDGIQTNVDTNNDWKPDINLDVNYDGTPDVDIDTNNDGIADTSIDTNGDNIPDENVDYDYKKPFTFLPIDANGYYMKVGEAYGVYAKGEVENGDQKMYSKFYDYSSSRKYEYIFVYSESESTREGDINVKNHKRIKYVNNERFLRNVFGFDKYQDALDWKEDHHIEVVTRTPMSVSLNDIERADVIIVNNGSNMDYYKNAVEMNNIAHGAKTETERDDGKTVEFGSDIDFTDFVDANGKTVSGFEKVIKIYERVVVREDVAFVGSRNCINGTTFDTNLRKLMCMLYFVNKVEDNTEKAFAGRDIFMNYMKRYVDEPGTRYVDAAPPKTAQEVDVRYVKADNVTYSTLRQRYEEKKNEADSKLYPDFRAPSLRNNDYYNGRPYMHIELPGIHVGHPLVLDAGKAIVGGSYVDGKLEPRYDAEYAKANQQITLARYDYTQYQDSGLHEKQSDDDDGYYMRVVRTEEPRYNYVNYQWVQDPNGKYVYHNWQYIEDPTRYYKEDNVYYYDNAYNSMCNATDFAYVDDNGTLQITSKYSSDNANGPYWFKIDYDEGINGEYAFRRITWNDASYSSWPWSDGGVYMGKWVFAKGTNGNSANLHMYYDYIAWGAYRPSNVPNGNQSYKNQTLEAENALFKDNSKLIQNAVTGRKVEREKDDPKHIYNTVKKDYYISMNILNGDGVVKVAGLESSKRNKTMYFNAYEKDTLSNIPISIRIKSSCKINKIRVYSTDSPGFDIVYSINKEPGESVATLTGTAASPGTSITLQRQPGVEETTTDKTPIYIYETTEAGRIMDVVKSYFIGNRNTKVFVELYCQGPDGKEKKVSDEIMIVKRDFFMLD